MSEHSLSAEAVALHHAMDGEWNELHDVLVKMLPGERRALSVACSAVSVKAAALNDDRRSRTVLPW